MEDPVGSPVRRGRADLEAFWDEVHQMGTPGTVSMVSGPNVCGLEAAWAFQLEIPLGEQTVYVSIIDVAEFSEDGRIRQNRAFWNEGTIRIE